MSQLTMAGNPKSNTDKDKSIRLIYLSGYKHIKGDYNIIFLD